MEDDEKMGEKSSKKLDTPTPSNSTAAPSNNNNSVARMPAASSPPRPRIAPNPAGVGGSYRPPPPQPIQPVPGNRAFVNFFGHPSQAASRIRSTPSGLSVPPQQVGITTPQIQSLLGMQPGKFQMNHAPLHLNPQQASRPAASKKGPSTTFIATTTSTTQAQKPQVSLIKNSGKKKRGRPRGKRGKKNAPRASSRGKSAGSSSSRKPLFTIQDDDPKRLVNPLLDIPYVDSSTTSGPPPQAADVATIYWGLAFMKPDTFPLAYHARLLGFNVAKRMMHSKQSVSMNVQTLPLLRDGSIYNVPPLGRWLAQTQIMMGGGNELEFVDPLYALLQRDDVAQSLPKLTPTTTIPCMNKELQQQVLTTLDLNDDSTSSNNAVRMTVSPQGLFTIKFKATTIELCYSFSWFPIHKRESELVLHVSNFSVPEFDTKDETTQQAVLTVVALVLDHARSSHVWYGLWQHTPNEWVPFLEQYFAMKTVVQQQNGNSEKKQQDESATSALAQSLYQAAATIVTSPVTSPVRPKPTVGDANAHDGLSLGPPAIMMDDGVPPPAESLTTHSDFLTSSTSLLVCDLHSSSTRYTSLLYQQDGNAKSPLQSLPDTRQRMLVRLPTVEQATMSNTGTNVAAVSSLANTGRPVSKRLTLNVSSAKDAVRGTTFGVRVSTTDGGLKKLDGSGNVVAESDATTAKTPAKPTFVATTAPSAAAAPKPSPASMNSLVASASTAATLPGAASASAATTAPSTTSGPPAWDVLKVFEQVIPSSTDAEQGSDEDDEILRELKAKQSQLEALENSDAMETKVRSLMQAVVDERMEYEQTADKRERERQMLADYEKILDRRKEMDTAWQRQLEQDMDAVCEICRDGEVTPDNQILFCEACNVAVHQMCYGIEEVPEGDYYCIACRYLGRDKMSKALLERSGEARRVTPTPLPICCELCPRKQGAFVRSDTSLLETKNADGTTNPVLSKWVHVVCAKWQGLNFVPLGQTDVVEDVQELKRNFLRHGYSCILCLGRRGAYVQCREEGCESWMHVTCARASGLCEVSHGENCHGDVDTNPWSLLCPQHSTVDPASNQNRVSIDQLVRAAEEFPPEPYVEPIRERPKKVFNKMNGEERRQFLADPECEKELMEELAKKMHGVHCEVCHQCEDDGKNLKKCCGCGVVFCASCVIPDVDVDPDEKDYTCPACKYVAEMEKDAQEYEDPQCTMCFQKGGWLREAFAEPVNRRTYWKQHPQEFEGTLFAKDLWCHAVCTMWHPKVSARVKDGVVNCSDIIMTNGKGHINGSVQCSLCGDTRKMKVSCSEEGCRCWGQKRGPHAFHVTCAREAGLEVKDKVDDNGLFFFDTKCFQHGGADFAFRARMEDLIEIERRKFGKRFEKYDSTFMSLAHASRLYNKAIIVMKMLGWAWRWAEWWVEFGDNWEPLLEPGEREEDMTKEELKIVDSTRESRCEAARKCRLAAFGAALRNRDYDKEVGDDYVPLDRALRAVLHTPELVGPLEPFEIDFFADWLGRVYRSKSRLLGFGDDKIPINGCIRTLNSDDQSPKYLLGSRRLPGKQELAEGEVFETDFHDVDDFLKPETFDDGSLVTPEALQQVKRGGRPKRSPEKTVSRPQKLSRRGKKSQYGSHSESLEATASSALTDDNGPTITLAAVYTEAPEEGSKEDGGVSRIDLLPSPVQAAVSNFHRPGRVVPRKRRAAGDETTKPAKKEKKGRGGWPKGRKRGPVRAQEEQAVESAPVGGTKEEEEDIPSTETVGKKRGRRQKSTSVASEETADVPFEEESDEEVMPVPKRRGRKPRGIAREETTDDIDERTTRFRSSESNVEVESSQEAAPNAKKRGGRSRKPNQRTDDSTSDAKQGITGQPRRSTSSVLEEPLSIGEAAPVPKARRGRQPTKASSNASASSTTKKTGRPQKTRASIGVDNAAVNSAPTESAWDQIAMIGNIAERIKRRRGLVVDPPESPQERVEGVATSADESSEKTESTDDDVTIAAYVEREKEARGESSSELARNGSQNDESSETSSECAQEAAPSEMTPRQRGRRRGKMNASSMWN